MKKKRKTHRECLLGFYEWFLRACFVMFISTKNICFGDGLKSKHKMVIIHDIEMTAHELLLYTYTLHRLDGWLMSFCVGPASNCSTWLGCSELLLDSKMTHQDFAICSSLFALRSSLFGLWPFLLVRSSFCDPLLHDAPLMNKKCLRIFPLLTKFTDPLHDF